MSETRQSQAIVIQFPKKPLEGDQDLLEYNALLNKQIINKRMHSLREAERKRSQQRRSLNYQS